MNINDVCIKFVESAQLLTHVYIYFFYRVNNGYIEGIYKVYRRYIQKVYTGFFCDFLMHDFNTIWG